MFNQNLINESYLKIFYLLYPQLVRLQPVQITDEMKSFLDDRLSKILSEAKNIKINNHIIYLPHCFSIASADKNNIRLLLFILRQPDMSRYIIHNYKNTIETAIRLFSTANRKESSIRNQSSICSYRKNIDPNENLEQYYPCD